MGSAARKSLPSFWQKPALRTDEDDAKHRPVTWLELFLDVFFVIAVGGLAHELGANVTWSGLGHFVAQFLPLAWLWVGIAYYTERFETDGVENRLVFIAFMLAAGGMSVFSHGGLGSNYEGYVLCYAAGRALTAFLWLRAGYHDARFRPVSRIYGVGFSLAIVCQIVSTLADEPLRYLLFGLGLGLDMLTPLVAIPANRRLPRVSTSKHPERFGLFTILVLGETAVGVTTGLSAAHHVTLGQAVGASLGVVIGFSMWAVYFDFIARRPFKQGPWYLYAWTYLHLALYMSIVSVGAGILHATRLEGDVLAVEVRFLVVGSLGAFLVCVGVLEFLLQRSDDEPTHSVLSPAMKITCGIVLPVLGLIEADKYTFFVYFYPLLFVNVFYGHFTRYRIRPTID